LRKRKYDWLLENDLKTTKWRRISPKSEFCLFIPRDEKLLELYESYPKITDIFVVTNHTSNPEALEQEPPKTERNNPCPCGSGKKYKKCCGKSG